MAPGIVIIIIIVGMVLIMNLFIFMRRLRQTDKRAKSGKGRNYAPPTEAERMKWRDMEIARRIQNEQNDALERVNLRNATLAYYEAVKQRHEKIDALKRMGIDVDESKVDEIAGLSLEEYLNMR